MQSSKQPSRHIFDLSKARMLESVHGEQAQASARADMLSATQRAGDSVADWYVPIS